MMITRNRVRGPVFFLALISCAAAAVFVARAYTGGNAERINASGPTISTSSTEATGIINASRPLQATTPPLRGPVHVVRFALYDVDIYPHDAHTNTGIVALSFEDLSGAGRDLAIDLETGALPVPIGRVARAGDSLRGRSDLVLSTGRYRVYASNHPEHFATLIVEP